MNNLKMETIMKTTNTIKNFAMRFAAVIAVVLLAGNAWGATSSVSISSYASSHSWANDTKYSSVTIDDYVTASASGSKVLFK